MVLTRWLQTQLKKTDMWRELTDRLYHLDKEISELKTKSTPTDPTHTEHAKEEWIGSPMIIEYLNVEKIVVDRYEQSNNFGALGIKSLEGRLNIGANYGLSDAIPEEKQKEIDEKLKKAKMLYQKKPMENKSEQANTPPKTTIRSRSGDAS